jgi:hypothetical protein
MTKPPAPSRPYTGPPDKRSAGSNKPIDRIVVHSTVSPCKPGGARDISRYFRSEQAAGSAHYVVDPAEAVQSAWDSVICWHAPPNRHSIGVEMCDMPGPVPGDSVSAARRKALRRVWRWRRPEQRDMLARTARLVAELCAAYDVPPRFVTATMLRKGMRGVTTHAEVSKAWKQSTHWDPGWWPRFAFMRRVRREHKAIMAPHLIVTNRK